MLESEQTFEQVKDISSFFDRTYKTQPDSYVFSLYKEIKLKLQRSSNDAEQEELKKYVFIIDEINRGEISKIFGELFYSIDPGYRGRKGEISTQFANMHSDPDWKFYVPENVYIIGTMNDIDRSVDSFDFAMRRRFRFIELKANDRVAMLDSLRSEETKEEAIKRMNRLNEAIVNKEFDLNENYQIGPAYFCNLDLSSEKMWEDLWTDYLQPLLQEYIRGLPDEPGIMGKFERAYFGTGENEDGTDG